MKAAIYTRISQDKSGEALGVARQESDCRALAEKAGLEVSEIYSDNDLSAYNGKHRPGYERLLKDAQAGAFDVIVAWHPDRLYRRVADLEQFIGVLEARGIGVQTVQAGHLDLSTPSGRLVARMLGSAASYESEHKAERNRRKHEELAKAGLPAGGGTRPFGFKADRVSLVEAEAKIVREAVARVGGGESVSSILRDLTERGVRSSTGRPWALSGFRRMLTSPRIAGLRGYQQRTKTGAPKLGPMFPAVWPAIVSREDWERCRSILTDPGRRTTGPSAGARKYLLSGILRCQRCGNRMAERPRDDGAPRYICPAPPRGKGCGGTYSLVAPLDELIVEAVLTAISGPALADALKESDGPADGTVVEITRLEEKLSALAADFGADRVSRAEWLTARDAVEATLEELRASLGRQRSRALAQLAGLRPEALREIWDRMTLDERREVLEAVVSRITLGPAVRGRNYFDPERVAVEWRA